MTSYPFCEDRTVTIRKYPEGERKVAGIVFSQLAVIRIMNSPDYTIVHLPSGFTFKTAACCFRYQHTAVDAMKEIAALRNSWTFDDPNQLRSLKSPIEAIGLKHGGYSAAIGGVVMDYKEGVNPESSPAAEPAHPNTVVCPVCSAGVGQPCKRPKPGPHSERVKLVREGEKK